VPLNDVTRKMMSTREFAMMKRGAILINTCRGPVVDEDALHQALTSGTLAGPRRDGGGAAEEESPALVAAERHPDAAQRRAHVGQLGEGVPQRLRQHPACGSRARAVLGGSGAAKLAGLLLQTLEGDMPKKIPYSTDPNDLFNPGQAGDFFDPEYGDAPSDAAVCAEMARLAYLRHEDPGGRSKLETILRDRARFEPGPSFNSKGTQGFVAARSSAGGDMIQVVAFRGTEPGESIDLRQDSRFWPTR
jgi:hypothetical protein